MDAQKNRPSKGRVRLPPTKEVVSVRGDSKSIGVLDPGHIYRLQTITSHTVKLRGNTAVASCFPVLEFFPMGFAVKVCQSLKSQQIPVQDIRLQGNIVAACLNPDKECDAIEFVFNISPASREKLAETREILLTQLGEHLPASCKERDLYNIAGAYVESMMMTGLNRPEDGSWTKFILTGTAGSPNLICKFVQTQSRPSKLDEHSVQIILQDGQLQSFIAAQQDGRRLDEAELPDLQYECLVGTPEQAMKVLTPAPYRARRKRRNPLTPLKQPNFATYEGTDGATHGVVLGSASQRQGGTTSGYMNKMLETAKATVDTCGRLITCSCLRKDENALACDGKVIERQGNLVREQPGRLGTASSTPVSRISSRASSQTSSVESTPVSGASGSARVSPKTSAYLQAEGRVTPSRMLTQHRLEQGVECLSTTL